MPFIPHTANDTQEMLAVLEIDHLETLFEEVPPELLHPDQIDLPEPLGEMALARLMRERASQDERGLLCFTGGGAYEHHIPAAIWEIASRGEFYSAYTPYQAEASQGTLQVLYEYQTMMAGLTAMEVVNASLYDGATALGEAILMAVRAKPDCARRVLLPATLHPHYRQVVQTLLNGQEIEIVPLPFCNTGGHTVPESLHHHPARSFAALVIPQPNFFGILEEVHALTNWAHQQGGLVIGLVNPLSLGLLQPPGLWGDQGADIACGDGQPLGIPLSSGGPYFGFMGCKQAYLRQMPGRIAGRTKDKQGKEGFVLTLQAREQHIRRAKATSNICTNQGLMTVAATLYLSLLGPEGLHRTAAACHANTADLARQMQTVAGLSCLFDRPFFHEIVLQLPCPAPPILARLEQLGISGGIALAPYDGLLRDCLLVCATETRTPADNSRFAHTLKTLLAEEKGHGTSDF
ncbi:MAG: aminomethyl-transferring glycine dehydrogenase subunit GcvPA [Magnetococcales bacterium]|nr:aminomethyl-transferring glycine dehydrogenase subunit GcvPA [Magnetococcales bacterium]